MESYIHCGPNNLSLPDTFGELEKSFASNLARGMPLARKTTPGIMAEHLSEKFILPEARDGTDLDSLYEIWVSML